MASAGVALLTLDAADSLPLLSTAVTTYEYWVPLARPVCSKEVPACGVAVSLVAALTATVLPAAP